MQGGEELPHRRLLDLMGGPAHGRAHAEDQAEAEFPVGEVIDALTVASPLASPDVSSPAPKQAEASIPRANMRFSAGGRVST